MVHIDAHEHSLQFTWPVILNSVSSHSSPIAVEQRVTTSLPLLRVCSFLSQYAETGNARKSAGNARKSAGKVRKCAEKVRKSAEHLLGEMAHRLSFVSCAPSNGFSWPMSMAISSARAGAEREILVEQVVECSCVLR